MNEKERKRVKDEERTMALRGEVKLMGAKAKVKEMLKASSTNMKCKEQRKRNMRNRMEDIFGIYE